MKVQPVASEGRLGASQSVVVTSDLAALGLPACHVMLSGVAYLVCVTIDTAAP